MGSSARPEARVSIKAFRSKKDEKENASNFVTLKFNQKRVYQNQLTKSVGETRKYGMYLYWTLHAFSQSKMKLFPSPRERYCYRQ